MNSGLGNYRLSDALGSSWYAMPMPGFACAIIVGSLYSVVAVYLPYRGSYRMFLPAVFAGGLGAMVWWTLRASKCRNLLFAICMGLLSSMVAIYAIWAMFVFLLVRRDTLGVDGDKSVALFSIWSHPAAVWESAKDISIFGWYAINGYATSGWKLWAMWAAEAGLFVIVILWGACGAIWKRVYCERCGVWCHHYGTVLRVAFSSDEMLHHRLMDGDASVLRELPAVEADVRPHLAIDLDCCDECSDMATMSWKLVGADKERLDIRFVDRRLIAGPEVAELVALGEKNTEDGETKPSR